MKTIQFVTNESTTTETASPWARPKGGSYQDRVLKPEFSDRKLKFADGPNWFRIVPAIQPSPFGWMMPLHVIHHEGGHFAHPRTLRPNAKSPFDHAYTWALSNAPKALFCKANRDGARLLTDPMSVCWVMAKVGDKYAARLLLASGYDGSRGGVPGLGYQLWKLAREIDESGNVASDAVDPEKGLLVCIEKTQAAGAKYPSYNLRLGRQPTPIDALLAQAPPDEAAVLCPLENTIRELTDEEQWSCLGKVMAPENVALVRKSLAQSE